MVFWIKNRMILSKILFGIAYNKKTLIFHFLIFEKNICNAMQVIIVWWWLSCQSNLCSTKSITQILEVIALQKLWKMLFISSKKLFLFSRYSIFCISVLPSFSTCPPLLWRMIKDNDVINCLNKNSITHFVWYPEKEKRYDIETLSIDGVSDKGFYRKIMQKMYSKS